MDKTIAWIITPPPYVKGKSVLVRCPICHEMRYITFDPRYWLSRYTGRCRYCALQTRSPEERKRTGQKSGKSRQQYKITQFEHRHGKPWRETITKLYCESQWSLQKVAQFANVSAQTICNELMRWNIPRRSRGGYHDPETCVFKTENERIGQWFYRQ